MKKIAILYICTGKYRMFWEGFYKSAEKNLFPELEKQYFVFTDSYFLMHKIIDNVHFVYQKHEPWPYPTLNRFKYFLRVEKALEKFDYIMFINANTLIVQTIHANEILPIDNQKLFASIQPWFADSKPEDFPYENNMKSTAGIKKGDGKYYFHGAINGGLAKDFLIAVRVMAENIQKDLDNGIIALWHDESHWNKYLLDYKDDYRIINRTIVYDEIFCAGYEKRIFLIDKSQVGKGKEKLRKTIKSEIIKIARLLTRYNSNKKNEY